MFAGENIVVDRLRRSVEKLVETRIPYAVIGDLAVKAWIRTVDPEGYRNTPNVDLLIQPSDVDRALSLLSSIHQVQCLPAIACEGLPGQIRDAIRLVVSGERIDQNQLSTPEVSSCIELEGMNVLCLETLVRMKLDVNRTIDRVHLHDLCDFNLIDESWFARLPERLAQRLRAIVENPESLRGIINALIKKEQQTHAP